jgi:hypothetical protein
VKRRARPAKNPARELTTRDAGSDRLGLALGFVPREADAGQRARSTCGPPLQNVRDLVCSQLDTRSATGKPDLVLMRGGARTVPGEQVACANLNVDSVETLAEQPLEQRTVW